MTKQLQAISLCFTCFYLASCENSNDFDTVCSSFDQLALEDSKNTYTADQKFEYLITRVSKDLPKGNAALESLIAVTGFVPVEGRYELYQKAAKSVLKTDWQCESMEDLIKEL